MGSGVGHLKDDSGLGAISIGDRTIDPRTRIVSWSEGSVRLTPTEMALVQHLAEHTTETVSQEQLLLDVWDYNPRVKTRTVVATIHRLRAKIEPNPKSPRFLLHSRRGYRLVVDDTSDSGRAVSTASLPSWQTPWVGREELVRSLRRTDEPVVVLWGLGGTGKTRLAVEVAVRRAADFPGGIIYVDLDGVQAEQVMARIAGAVRAPPSDSLPTAVADALGPRGSNLLLLDACSHTPPALLEALDRVLETNPQTRIWLTSRAALPLPDAAHREVLPLDAPDAAALLVALTERIRPGWSEGVDPEVLERTAMALDGWPLALELVAVHSRVMSPEELEGTITEGRVRSAVEHALDRSWAELSPRHQEVLTRCTGFWGPFTLKTAMAMLATGDGSDGLDTLRELVDRAWLQVRRRRALGKTRYTMLSTVRRFVADKASPTVASENAARLTDWYTGLAQETVSTLLLEAVPALEPEILNIRGAWRNRPDDRPERGWLLAAVVPFRMMGPIGRDLLRDVTAFTARDDLDRELRIHLTWCEYLMLGSIDRRSAPPVLDRAFALAEGLPRLHLFLRLQREGWNTERTLDMMDGLVDEARALGDRGLILYALRLRGMSHLDRYQAASAMVDLSESVALSEVNGLDLSSVQARRILARCTAFLGRHAEAARDLAGLIKMCERQGWPGPVPNIRFTLSKVLASSGQYDEAAAVGTRATEGFGRLGMAIHAATAAGEVGLVLSDAGRRDEARERFAWSLTRVERLGYRDARFDLPGVGAARLDVDAGRLQVARRRLQDLQPESAWGLGSRALWLGICTALDGDLTDAEGSVSEGIGHLTRSQIRPWLCAAQCFHAAIRDALDQREQATDLLLTAEMGFRDTGLKHGVALCAAVRDRPASNATLDLRVMSQLIQALRSAP